LLVTGGAGFIGSAFIRYILANYPDDDVVNLDALSYAGNLANLHGLAGDARYRFIHGDIADREIVQELVAQCDAVVNFAAETHVDRSLFDSPDFVRANVTGVLTILEAIRQHDKRMIQVSTDEVYGDIEPGYFSVESDPLLSRSPYAAAKAGGELMCRAYVTSFGTDVVITRGCNTFGPYQHPEKLIPLFVTNALLDLPLPLYGDGLQMRDWLYVEDHAAAIDLVLRRGIAGAAYNIGTGEPRTNLEVAELLLAHLGKPASLIRHVADRPGHDRRYALNSEKIRRDLAWEPQHPFTAALSETIDWYVTHADWWQAIRADERGFASYYERQYGQRLAVAAPADGGRA
jgi:dTDP-glucose 4,6-dehydratase